MREITIPNKLLELLNVVTSKFTGLQRSDRLHSAIVIYFVYYLGTIVR